MLIEEARWFQERLATMLSTGIFPMCDVGSGSRAVRERQPWIEELVFSPLQREQVTHLDIEPGEGVDLVGDVTDRRTINQLSGRFRSVFCSNLLEHVRNREAVARGLADIVPPGGYIFSSCPLAFPYHPGPIDTMFRPTPAQLAALFPATVMLEFDVVVGGTHWDYMSRSPGTLGRSLARLVLPWPNPNGWIAAASALPWLFKHYAASCVVLRKLGAKGL